MSPLEIGTRVRVIEPPVQDGDKPTFSEVTTIVAVQWVGPEGEITDEQQVEFQYVLDAEDPHPDIAVRPEYLVVES